MAQDTLNKKIAEWVGFKRKKYRSPACKHEPRCEYWVTPDNNHYGNCPLPNFTNSLDAIFTWLVPKLREDQKQWSKFIEFMCGEAKNASRKSRYSRIINWLSDPMNICLAIEKVIDENKE